MHSLLTITTYLLDSLTHSLFLFTFYFSDAPAMSNELEFISSSSLDETATTAATATTTTTLVDKEGWDDEGFGAANRMKPRITTTSTSTTNHHHHHTVELLDMNTLQLKRREEDDIAERLRIEDTKAQLAAAKAGMEREAARLQNSTVTSTTTATTEPTNATGVNKSWVPPHMRTTTSSSTTTTMASKMSFKKFDTQSEELFPDLQTADAILLEKQQQQPMKPTMSTNTSATTKLGGATWGGATSTRPTLNLKKVPKKPPMESKPTTTTSTTAVVKEDNDVPSVVVEKAPEQVLPIKENEAKEPIIQHDEESLVSPMAVVPKKKPLVKKKKKDLSTFKPSSS